MPLEGQDKKDNNTVAYYNRKQLEIWPKLVKGEIEGIDLSKIDPEILQCCITGKYFRAEGHVSPEDGRGGSKTPMEELWFLYLGIQKLSEEEEARGKKPAKKSKGETAVEPIKARRIAGYPVLDKKGIPTGQFEYGLNFKTPEFKDTDGYLDFQSWLYARDQARKDLLWLNREVLRNTLVTEQVHKPICDQFCTKVFDGVYHPGYLVQEVTAAISRQNRVPLKWDSETKNYISRSTTDVENPENYCTISLTNDARDFFKSTIGMANVIQWMLACPDISMIILSADNNLAEIFVNNIKRMFFLAKGAVPTALHLLFPEYILSGVKGTSREPLECPARRRGRAYPTLWSDSIESTLSGLHCDYLLFDDVVSNMNCLTEQTRKKLQNHIDTTMSVCDTWGKIDIIGTRYFPDDYYGVRIARANEDSENHGLKMYVRAAWYVKPEFAHIGNKKIRELKENMVTLTFPEHASWKFLQGKLVNEYVFRCQYLNEPVLGEESIDMPMDLLLAHRYLLHEWQGVPAFAQKGYVYVTGDMARSAKKNSDWTVFVAMKIFPKKDGILTVVVLDCDYGRWTQTEISQKLAEFIKKWNPLQVRIEDDPGFELFKSVAIPSAFRALGVPLHNIYFAPIEQGPDAKRNRIKGLEVLLKADRLYFEIGPWNQEMFSQLSLYKGDKSTRTRKDDIPDAMSWISKYLPSSVPLTPKQQEEENKRKETEIASKLLALQHKIVFGNNNPSGTYVPPQVNYEPPQPDDPLSEIKRKLFGGNGMR